MNLVRVLVAEDNLFQQEALIASLSAQQCIQVVGAASNGVEAVRMVIEEAPQVLICDMVMPQLDGFGVLERVSRMDPLRRPRVIVLTALNRDDFIGRAISLGASYYMVKPVDPGFLAHQVLELARSLSPDSAPPPAPRTAQGGKVAIDGYVADLLLRIGVPPHLNGYKFIRQAVMMAIEQPRILDRVTKSLYPAVADHFQTTPSRVERSIRHAIYLTWERGGAAPFAQIVERSDFPSHVRPTNCEFIALLSERIRFRLDETPHR